MIYVFGGIKGGSGKSTICTNLTIMRAKAGKDVLLVDADSVDNQNATDFSTIRQEQTGERLYTSIQLAGKAVRDDVLKLKAKFDDIFIDVGGHDSLSQRAGLSVADVLLVPVFPSSFDAWTFENVSNMVEEAQAVNPDLKAYAFLSRADISGSSNEEAADVLKEYENFTYIDAPIKNRKAFRTSAGAGLAVVEHTPKDAKAIAEIEALYRCIFDT